MKKDSRDSAPEAYSTRTELGKTPFRVRPPTNFLPAGIQVLLYTRFLRVPGTIISRLCLHSTFIYR